MDITPDDLKQNQNAELTTDEVRDAIDSAWSTTPSGPYASAITDTLRGINITQTPGAVPFSRDLQGFAFFTRPTMNMAAGNLRLRRSLARLLDNREDSLRRYIRACLDADALQAKYPSSLLNAQYPFIPILTNQLISISGFPDKEAIAWDSKPGYYKEVVSFIDSTSDFLGSYEVNANFRNIPGDPVTEMIAAWIDYASLAFQGIIIPKHKYLVRNQVDYQTRIYRIILDPTRKYVQNIFAANAAFPLSAPTGARATIEEGGPLTQVNNQISVRFHCVGFIANDDILVDEFNAVVTRANNSMRDDFRTQDLVKLQEYDKPIFKHDCYPYINPNTMELEWWVDADLYSRTMGVSSEENQNVDNIY